MVLQTKIGRKPHGILRRAQDDGFQDTLVASTNAPDWSGSRICWFASEALFCMATDGSPCKKVLNKKSEKTLKCKAGSGARKTTILGFTMRPIVLWWIIECKLNERCIVITITVRIRLKLYLLNNLNYFVIWYLLIIALPSQKNKSFIKPKLNRNQ